MKLFPNSDNPGEWDRFIAASMQARPEIRYDHGADLAAAAIARANSQQARTLHLNRMMRQTQWFTLAAAILLVAVLAAGLYSGFQLSSAATTETEYSSTASTASTTENATISQLEAAGATLLLLLAAALATKCVLSPDHEPLSREIGVTPW